MTIVFDMDNTLVDELGAGTRPGIVTLLEKLQSDGHTLVLWTNSRRDRAHDMLTLHDLRRHFTKVICREDHDPNDEDIRKGKPASTKEPRRWTFREGHGSSPPGRPASRQVSWRMPNWEPERLGEHTWLLPTGVNVGLWEDSDGAVLVDSGGDKDAGRRIRQVLDARGWKLRLIVNTHSNADHVGGNAYLQKQTGCRIAATRLEAAFVTDPVLEPAFLWGAAPLRELRGKFLQAEPSAVDMVIPDAGQIPGTPLEAVPLPGHFMQMIGVLTPDRVLFAGDSLFGEEVLAKHPVFFLHDVAGHLETLKRLETLSVDHVVPGHGRPVREAGPLIAANRAALQRTAETVRSLCAQPSTFEDVLAGVCSAFSIELNASQYVLVGCTLRAYLTWLSDQGTLRTVFREGRMLWGPA